MLNLKYKNPVKASHREITIVISASGDNKLKVDRPQSIHEITICKAKFTIADLQDIGYQIASDFPFSGAHFKIDDSVLNSVAEQECVQWISFGLSLAGYSYQHKQECRLESKVNRIEIDSTQRLYNEAHEKGLNLALAQNYARDLMNMPANQLYPESFVSAVEEKELPNVSYSTIGEAALSELGFGGLVGISQGSDREGQLLIMDYQPEQPVATIALVGKGVTFDTGGISIKGARFMSTMKFDMGGAAAVVGAMHAIANANLPVRVIGLCGLVENMPSGKAIRPGDVVTMLSGKSVEIISTDAEGRMVLADVLRYAQNTFKPDYLIDIATLTGGAGVALGKGYSALMGNSAELLSLAEQAGQQCAETVWPMPIGGWFENPLKSEYADLRHGSEDPHGSPCVAATFLQHFIDDQQKWIHIDSAAMSHDMSYRKIYDKAATGYGALLLSELCHTIATSEVASK